MERSRGGRPINWSKRTVSGQYFDLACALVGVSQEEVARRADVRSSTLSRGFAGQRKVDRAMLLKWGDILLDLCPTTERGLLLEMEAQMLHALGHATRSEEQNSIEQLSYYQQRVQELLNQRHQTDS